MFMETTPFITVRASRPLSEIEFCAWVAQAVPGDRLEYHRGFLVLDVFPMFSKLSNAQRVALHGLGSRAFWAAELALVHLVQERVGPDQFAYIAVARPKPKAAAVSLSELLLAEQGQPCDATGSSGRAAA
ncbi:hypothetical protein [Roseisalinus antarcticus]|uniref:Uncharacterized protein n=1 Tax=Roseisalinus antarcticus TaxID=254357 RepID=A0A1Y5TYU8_9RHOB|nr:hypothetical protein [Roseisalinus antarcticus]SLN77209.1 hypothetical protein ROA7023_04329 [Roseisalinus antarcticus]